MPMHANPMPIEGHFLFLPVCQSVPILANACHSWSIHANPCQSMPILCQSGVILSFRKIANLGQYVPIQSKCFSQTHILQRQFKLSFSTTFKGQSIPITVNSLPILRQHRATLQTQCQSGLLLLRQFKGHPVLHLCQSRSCNINLEHVYTNASKLKVDWHSNGKGFPNPGQSGANFMPFTRTFVWITKEQVFYTGWSLVYSEDKIQAT